MSVFCTTPSTSIIDSLLTLQQTNVVTIFKERTRGQNFPCPVYTESSELRQGLVVGLVEVGFSSNVIGENVSTQKGIGIASNTSRPLVRILTWPQTWPSVCWCFQSRREELVSCSSFVWWRKSIAFLKVSHREMIVEMESSLFWEKSESNNKIELSLQSHFFSGQLACFLFRQEQNRHHFGIFSVFCPFQCFKLQLQVSSRVAHQKHQRAYPCSYLCAAFPWPRPCWGVCREWCQWPSLGSGRACSVTVWEAWYRTGAESSPRRLLLPALLQPTNTTQSCAVPNLQLHGHWGSLQCSDGRWRRACIYEDNNFGIIQTRKNFHVREIGESHN